MEVVVEKTDWAKGRLISVLIIMFAFLIPIMTTMVVIKSLAALWAIIPMLIVFIWLSIELSRVGVNVRELTKTGVAVLVFGLALTAAVVIMQSLMNVFTLFLMMIAVMILTITIYYFI